MFIILKYTWNTIHLNNTRHFNSYSILNIELHAIVHLYYSSIYLQHHNTNKIKIDWNLNANAHTHTHIIYKILWQCDNVFKYAIHFQVLHSISFDFPFLVESLFEFIIRWVAIRFVFCLLFFSFYSSLSLNSHSIYLAQFFRIFASVFLPKLKILLYFNIWIERLTWHVGN